MDRSRVGIVIPALNEAATIAQVVAGALRYGQPIVVDDGSSDQTAMLAREAGAIVVVHGANLGYDAALNSGFAKAAEIACEVIISLDADGQHNPDLIGCFLDQIAQGADIVVGARDRRARLAEHVFAWFARWRYGICDPLCGMKAYRVAVYRALGHFDSYRSIGTELALFGIARKFRVVEVPIAVRDRVGQSRFGQRISSNLRIFRAMWFAMFVL